MMFIGIKWGRGEELKRAVARGWEIQGIKKKTKQNTVNSYDVLKPLLIVLFPFYKRES